MTAWIVRAKDTLKEIIDNVVECNPNIIVRVAFVGYRDIKVVPRFTIKDFSDDINQVKEFISEVKTLPNFDIPEDV
jgi:hypothetical protein